MIRPNFLTTADRLELLSCVKRQREDHGVARRFDDVIPDFAVPHGLEPDL